MRITTRRARAVLARSAMAALLVGAVFVGQPSLAGADPQTDPMPFETMDPGPTSGTLPNGTAWTVDNGSWSRANPLSAASMVWILPGNTGGASTFTFDRSVDLSFGVDGLNTGDESVRLPLGTVVVDLHPSHAFDPATGMLTRDQLDSSCSNNPCVSTFTLNGVTSFAPESVGSALRLGLTYLDVTADVPVVGVSMFNPWVTVPGIGLLAVAVVAVRRRFAQR